MQHRNEMHHCYQQHFFALHFFIWCLPQECGELSADLTKPGSRTFWIISLSSITAAMKWKWNPIDAANRNKRHLKNQRPQQPSTFDERGARWFLTGKLSFNSLRAVAVHVHWRWILSNVRVMHAICGGVFECVKSRHWRCLMVQLSLRLCVERVCRRLVHGTQWLLLHLTFQQVAYSAGCAKLTILRESLDLMGCRKIIQ